MPKTIEELELEMGKIKGELIAKQKELDAATVQVAHAAQAVKDAEAKIAGYETKERSELEAVIHGFDPKLELKDKKLEVLQAMVEGTKIGHAAPAPTPPPAAPLAPPSGKKVSEMERIFNA